MLIKKAYIRYQDEKSDKVYEVEIVYHGWNKYQVDFSYGRTGRKLKSDTNTKIPVSLNEAETIFDELVNYKHKRGFFISKFSPIYYEYLLEISLPKIQKIIN
ncbi:MAG: WGR domain-containing protein [Okeania sp. SIO2G4]|uniref:WGR domain-containing protein n=1 Tax=unclassified Okeania TaxID=2634635 RepID=UPI0013B705DE|nr:MULTISPECIES: WGR domain-containing protein [unclassified Okeania]NEP07824.1 WGR domain-containing protein [Okeania sp. SIO4D6]NEP38365.1 WGR domain-containing protein [Okeania sp. SIO2H7]NEP72025.1 WGR domain-containing protein [Okeania sp. SIO2G5]NEP93515.1 WGR domain-containing protein [Okeania sp. SIO2F5]NEQ93472.1 WGR domain-containing protein [Okeania sp. SIO2G4]